MKENYTPMTMAKSDYRKMVEPYKEEALKTLKEYVDIDSVYDESTITKEHPFGQGVENALSYVAKLGEKLGFHVDRCDNYVTELTYGEGDKTFDIYAHSDVVPVIKKNWTKKPFELIEEDGVLYGRGTCDDKGPGLACLYAVKALMDNNRLGGYKMRFLFGGNEERDSLCLEHYFHTMKKGYPTLGISPDADYPLIYAEKSIYAYNADYEVKIPNVKDFHLGDALNIVLSEVEVELDEDEKKVDESLKEYLKEYPKLQARFESGRLWMKGIPAHGSMPYLGINAGLHLIDFLGRLYHIDLLSRIAEMYFDGLGKKFHGDFTDEYFKETSYNVGRIGYEKGHLTLSVNFRFPASMDIKTLLEKVSKLTSSKLTLLGGSQGFVSDPKSDFVQILLHSYQKETNDYESKPLAIGGGTYARESKNSVAFGAAFPGRDYRMHGDDEYFPISDFFDNMQIYAHAIDDISEYLRSGKKPF